MTGQQILVVDDEVRVLASLRRGLELSGFDVVTAGDGARALALVRSAAPDAMVLDVNMPELDGVGVVTALRAMGNDHPICVL
ncbi:response regulator, partial [Nocardia sp. NPDC058497]|uniref:response regulator n=1 Tax=Nocardia sp. NPDC058497 TaxID=3346529 RepID=UPI00364834D2